MIDTVTHYAPWDGPDDFAYCGRYLSHSRYHSPAPTCPTCAARLAAADAIDQAIDEMPWPLDADEARAVLDPVLNAGVPEAPMPTPTFTGTQFVADLFDFAATLNRAYAQQFVKEGVR
jgi:hypothetical protein